MNVGRGEHVSIGTFETRAEAERALVLNVADRERGSWIDPRRGTILFKVYATEWLEHRVLRPRTRELYESHLRVHLFPTFGHLQLLHITPTHVRRWYADQMRSGKWSPVTVAKMYRLLRTILGTAVEDELLVKNPCLIRGAAAERSPERPVATVEQVAALADAVGPRLRALVLLATYSTLRFGELAGLTRKRIDLAERTVTVTEQAIELRGGKRVMGPPKTEAGRRTVSLPRVVVGELAIHLVQYVDNDPDAFVFTGPKGGPLKRANFSTKWKEACEKVGLEDFHFHDLRHTGNTLAAATGASTKELMARMGHSSARAALLYQHATRERDEVIAARLDAMLDEMG